MLIGFRNITDGTECNICRMIEIVELIHNYSVACGSVKHVSCIRKPQTHKKEGSSSESLENYCSLRFKTFALHCTQQCEYNSRLTFTDVTGAYLELKTCLDTGPQLQVCLQSIAKNIIFLQGNWRKQTVYCGAQIIVFLCFFPCPCPLLFDCFCMKQIVLILYFCVLFLS